MTGMVARVVRGLRSGSLALALTALAVGRAGAADPAVPQGPASLEWTVTPTAPCLDAKAFREGVEGALSRPPFGPAGSPRTLSVVAESINSTTKVVMALRDGDHEIGSRVIDVDGKNCKKARETVVLVAAMLLDVPSAPEEPETPAKAAEPPVAKDVPPPPPPRPRPSTPLSIQLEAGLAAAVTAAFLPRFGLGPRAEILLDLNDVPRVRFTAGWSRGATVEVPGGTVDFTGTELTLGAIPLEGRLGKRLQAFAFVSAAITAVHAGASGFGVARSETLWTPSAGAGGALRYRPFDERFVLFFEAAFLVPFARSRFAVVLPNGDELEVHSVGAIALDMSAGAGWQFR
jgi:hypothetical protein